MDRMPDALIIVDPQKEHIALKEAAKMGIPTISLIDTDSDPDFVDIPIPGNDDAMRSIEIVCTKLADAIVAGKAIWEEKKRLEDRKREEISKQTTTVRQQAETSDGSKYASSSSTSTPATKVEEKKEDAKKTEDRNKKNRRAKPRSGRPFEQKTDGTPSKEGGEKKEFSGGPKKPPYRGKRTDYGQRDKTFDKTEKAEVAQKTEVAQKVEVKEATSNIEKTEKTQAEKE